MAKKEATKAAPLSAMSGSGNFVEIAGKQYQLLPLKVKEVNEFTEDQINFGSQYLTLIDPEPKANLAKWLGRHLFTEDGSPVTLETIENDDWTVVDVKTFWRKLVDFSG